MRVIFYDHTDRLRHGNTEPVGSLQELLGQSDVVSLHVPETPATYGMIGRDQIRAMKQGAYLINNSRGTVVDLDALAEALRDGPAADSQRVLADIRSLEGTIRARLLYEHKA
jgi:D-3-phosphoglycerate dehydrogenase